MCLNADFLDPGIPSHPITTLLLREDEIHVVIGETRQTVVAVAAGVGVDQDSWKKNLDAGAAVSSAEVDDEPRLEDAYHRQ